MAALLNSLSFAFRVPNIFINKSGAVGYNVIGVYRWILIKFELEVHG